MHLHVHNFLTFIAKFGGHKGCVRRAVELHAVNESVLFEMNQILYGEQVV